MPKVSSSFEFCDFQRKFQSCQWQNFMYVPEFEICMEKDLENLIWFRSQNSDLNLVNKRRLFLVRIDKEPIISVFTWLGPFINANNSILGGQRRLHLLIICTNELCFIKNHSLLISVMNSIHGFAFLRDLRGKWYLQHWNGEKAFDLAERNFYVSGFTGFWFLGELY